MQEELEKRENLSIGFNTFDAQEKKTKTRFQLEDQDAPDDTQSVKITKDMNIYEGKKHKVTKKFYGLSDGTQHVVEIEEI